MSPKYLKSNTKYQFKIRVPKMDAYLNDIYINKNFVLPN